MRCIHSAQEHWSRYAECKPDPKPMQWLWLVMAVLFALNATLRLYALLTRGMNTMDLVLPLMNVATAAIAAFVAFRLVRR